MNNRKASSSVWNQKPITVLSNNLLGQRTETACEDKAQAD